MRTFTRVKQILLLLLLLSQNETYAALSCESVFLKVGAQILHERDGSLHTSAPVQRAVSKHTNTTGIVLTKPVDKINQWLDYLTKISTKANSSPKTLEKLNSVLNSQFGIKFEEVPESYYDFQARLARERGQGVVKFTEIQKKEMAAQIVADQKRSLEVWTEFLVSSETSMYPMWLKYWMFNGMTKLSKYDPSTGAFGNRDKGTVTPFPELNREVIARVVDLVMKKLNKQSLDEINDSEMVKSLEGMNFGKIYGKLLFKIGFGKAGGFATNEGKWILYPKGSDHLPLVRSLEGKNTGWCTAGEATAKDQLSKGDFHVFYSLDEKGEPTIPRIAIRMDSNEIREVRGVAKNQELDLQISDTTLLSDRLAEMKVDATLFDKKTKDMKQLTEIESKQKIGTPLTKEDLVFLYETEGEIQGFGYKKDPRIAEIISQRNLREDVIKALEGRYSKEEISFDGNEVVHGVTRVVYADYYFKESILPENYVFPEMIFGTFGLENLTSVKNVVFPKSVDSFFAPALRTAEGVVFPEARATNTLYRLDNITSMKNVKFPQKFKTHLSLSTLRNVENVQMPEVVIGMLDLSRLISGQGLILPKFVNLNVSLGNLQSVDGLKLPETIGKGGLNLSSLPSARGLVMPKGVRDYIGPKDFDGNPIKSEAMGRAKNKSVLLRKVLNFFSRAD